MSAPLRFGRSLLICLGSGIITSDFRQQMKQARDRALGPREERSAAKPTKIDGEYDGGAAFERDDSALNVRNAPRCYTLAQSYQVQRNIVGPAAGAKISMGEPPSDHLLLRKEILEVRATSPARSRHLISVRLPPLSPLLRWNLRPRSSPPPCAGKPTSPICPRSALTATTPSRPSKRTLRPPRKPTRTPVSTLRL